MAKHKILIIDDEESLSRSIRLNLEDTGEYEVQTESKGSNGVQAAKEFQPDLILLDFIMPDMDGSDVALKLQQEQTTQGIPIVFLTAIATQEDIDNQGQLIGGNIVLAKPVSTDKLIEAIQNNLKQ